MNELVIFSRDETALVEAESIGHGSRIGAFARVVSTAVIGENCTIGTHANLEDGVILGDRVAVRPGVHLHAGTIVENDVQIGAHSTIGDASSSAPIEEQETAPRTVVKRSARLGANVTVLPGTTIGESSNIMAGSVVTRDVPPFAIVTGNPASIVGYGGISAPEQESFPSLPPSAGRKQTAVNGVTLHRLPSAVDMRGQLSYAEIGKELPFEIKRFFLVYGVANQEVRGEHAHRTLHQLLICVHGRCNVVVDDSKHRQEFLLDDPTLGLHVPPLVWAIQYKHSSEAVLLVLASDFYDSKDYIRNYSDFLAALGDRREL